MDLKKLEKLLNSQTLKTFKLYQNQKFTQMVSDAKVICNGEVVMTTDLHNQNYMLILVGMLFFTELRKFLIQRVGLTGL